MKSNIEEIQKLYDEGVELMTKLLPGEDFGEDYDAERLHEILTELKDKAILLECDNTKLIAGYGLKL